MTDPDSSIEPSAQQPKPPTTDKDAPVPTQAPPKLGESLPSNPGHENADPKPNSAPGAEQEASPSSPSPQAAQKAEPSTEPTEPPQPEVSLDIVVVDSGGLVLPGLALRVWRYGSAGKVHVVDAKTDKSGAIPPITTLPLGSRFEIQIRNDRGIYMMAAIGTVQSQRMTGNLMLPHQRFEFATYSHEGTPGTAEKAKRTIANAHSQKPDGRIDVARNATAAPTVTLNRDEQGNPKGIITSGARNMLGQNQISASNPNLGLNAPDKVKALLEFGMEQLTWIHPGNLTSQTIIERMKRSTYTHENRPNGLGSSQTLRRCTKYVKIALWKAGYIPNDGDFDPNTSPASKLGPGLLRAGFSDITESLPDARWAAPGDVIVYRRIGAPEADGHIDIRTYDGYLSDFWDSYLPVSQFEVIGIYRKYYDPLPERRVRAFLKVIRSREAETLFKTAGDAATYRALPYSGRKGEAAPRFESFADHPFANSSEGRNASGAYGIRKSSFKLYTDLRLAQGRSAWVDVSSMKEKFSPLVQDRIAVAIMELHPGQGYGSAGYQTMLPTSLALVRSNKIAEAAKQLATVKTPQWTSLPGGAESNYSLEQLLADYQTFYDE
ncbi:hypothetical protein AACH06_17105 [Ideonella sp. DXS29W]|uniref:Uncharacterized protein n=1 Tax=Ideonella lacteola TaxID=2984193 RepID=A0ABU9BRF6_9BURK